MRRKQIILISVIFIGVILILSSWGLLHYGYRQAKGQLEVISNTVPIKEVLEDPDRPDSVKFKINYIQEVKTYAVDSLGLEGERNYTTFYDQQGKELMWVVTACPPFKLEAYTWKFPILGSFSYKGFFDKEMAEKEERNLKDQGYDTMIRNASGWSTLGILKDPILSGMLVRPEGSLANLIIHELTHTTIFIKDDVSLNENLATFIGNEGARLFLKDRHGASSGEYASYIRDLEDRQTFTEYVLLGVSQLSDLYNGFDNDRPREEKRRLKNELITDFIKNVDTLTLNNSSYYRNIFNDYFPNNAFFMSYLRYGEKQDEFRQIFEQQFKGDLPGYIKYLKRTY